MRVITGSARGTPLKTLEGEEITRPTGDRVKQALFNALQFDVEGRSILDLFAGSGQLGIEALSRGAKECVFVERDLNAAEVVKQNLKATKLFSQAHVLTADAVTFSRNTADRFDIVFLDPPYASDLIEQTLPLLCGKIKKNGTAVCETDCDKELPEQCGALSLVRCAKYGKTLLWFYRNEE